MTQWNDALSAYDDECEVIEAIREEYAGYLRSAFEPFGQAVAERLGSEWRGQCSGEGPRTAWWAQPRRVRLSAWTPRAWAGPARTLAVAVSLDVRGKGFSQADGATRRRLFVDAAASVLGDLPGAIPSAAVTGDDPSHVRTVVVPLGAGSAATLADRAMGLADLAAALDGFVSLCTWLESILGAMAGEPPPIEQAGVQWESRDPRTWASGRYVQLDLPAPAHSVWICARPPGTLVLGHAGGAALDDRLRAALGVATINLPGEDEETRCSLLLDEVAAAKLHGARDVAAVEARIRAGLSQYFALIDSR